MKKSLLSAAMFAIILIGLFAAGCATQEADEDTTTSSDEDVTATEETENVDSVSVEVEVDATEPTEENAE